MTSAIPARDFRADLERGTQAETDPRLITALERHFGPIYRAYPVRLSLGQYFGLDLSIQLASGRWHRLQVKTRSKDYGDALLEFLSDAERNTPGWIQKPCEADWLAVFYSDSERLELFPFPGLQTAWTRYGAGWVKRFRTITTRSRGQSGRIFTSKAVAVPVGVIQAGIKAVSRLL